MQPCLHDSLHISMNIFGMIYAKGICSLPFAVCVIARLHAAHIQSYEEKNHSALHMAVQFI